MLKYSIPQRQKDFSFLFSIEVGQNMCCYTVIDLETAHSFSMGLKYNSAHEIGSYLHMNQSIQLNLGPKSADQLVL